MPVAPASPGRLGWVVAACVAVVTTIGVAANFSAIKTPNDGVYYVAAARALLDTGVHVDATMVPPGPPITRQNGIVYVLGALMAAGGRAWPVLYAAMVTALWTAAIAAMAGLYQSLGAPRVWLLAAFTVLQYDLLNDSTSFMNEAVYAPALFLCLATAGRALMGVRSGGQLRAAWDGLPPWFAPVALVFLAAGLFFRNQHVVLLPIVVAGFGLAGRTVAGAWIAVGMLAPFAAYAASMSAPVTDGYWQTVATFESVELSDLPYALAMFTGPLSLTKVLPYGHPVTIVAGVAGVAAVVAGLRRMRARHPLLAAAIGVYIALSLMFLVMLPFVSTRYYALVNLPLIAAVSVLLPAGARADRLLLPAVVIVAIVAAVYVSSYVSARKPEQAYPQLVAHQRAVAVADHALIYSSQPRMVSWVLGRPACAGAPPACAAALRSVGMTPAVVFIGRQDELIGQDGLRGYAIDRPLTDLVAGYGAWSLRQAGR